MNLDGYELLGVKSTQAIKMPEKQYLKENNIRSKKVVASNIVLKMDAEGLDRKFIRPQGYLVFYF